MAGMATLYGKELACSISPEARKQRARNAANARWRKDTTKVQQPAITLEQAIACLRNAIASKPGGTFYSAPFDRIATWLVSP